MIKTIISIVITFVVLGGIVLIAAPRSQNSDAIQEKSSGILRAEGDSEYDFGRISMAAGEVRYDFKIKNTGVESVVINKIYTSCMCTTAALMMGGRRFGPYGMPGHGGAIPKINQIINSGEEGIVEVVFDPAAHGPAGVGLIQRVVAIENNAGAPLELKFSAVVIP